MRTELFPYQIEGANFLAARRTALLADGMGLGKSSQAVRAADLVGADRIVVVAPAAVRFVWPREFAKWGATPRASVILRSGAQQLPAAGVVVVSWALIANPVVLAKLKGWRPCVLVLDESHFARNPDARRTAAVLGGEGLAHYCGRVWCLSGTPMPKHAGELFPMLNTLYSAAITAPGSALPMTRDEYEARYTWKRPFRISAWKTTQIVGGSRNLPELAERMAPFYLRRKAEDVWAEMPALRFGVLPLECPADPFESVSTAEGVPFEEAEGFNVAWHKAGLAKVPGIVALLEAEFDSGLDKIVLFAWHHDVMDALQAGLGRFGAARVDGATRDPAAEADRFQTDPECRVFIGQIQAAGAGLTLTAAQHCLFVEARSTPEDNAQAAKRIHRIGQNRTCFVRFAALAGSIDETVMEIASRRAADIAVVFG